MQKSYFRDWMKYPLFDEGDIASEKEEALRYGKKAVEIQDKATELRKVEDPKQVKKNKELSDEYKALMKNFFEENGQQKYHWRMYGAMIEANVAIKTGKKSLEDAESGYLKANLDDKQWDKAREAYDHWLDQ